MMTQSQVRISDVIYNAATQSFEASVTVCNSSKTRKYACAIDAPITMSFEEAADGLKRQALRRDRAGRGLYSQMKRYAPRVRAGREKFDPRRWLAEFFMPRSDAA